MPHISPKQHNSSEFGIRAGVGDVYLEMTGAFSLSPGSVGSRFFLCAFRAEHFLL